VDVSGGRDPQAARLLAVVIRPVILLGSHGDQLPARG
jgi:hypothetical protein